MLGRFGRHARAAVLAMLVSVFVVGAPIVASADPTPATDTSAPLPSDATKVAVHLSGIRDQLDALRTKASGVASRLTAAAIAVDGTDQQITLVSTQIDRMRAVLREQAATAYVRRSTTGLEQYSVQDAGDLLPGTKYLQVAGGLDGDQLSELLRAKDQLDEARLERTAVRDQLADQSRQLDGEQSELEAQSAADDAKLEAWGAVTVMGDAVLSAAQLAAWYRSTGAVPSLAPDTTIDDIARMYIEEGAAEHVRGDLAFAQAVVETSSFAVAAGNNFSGIGVCDSCVGGYQFDGPRAGVRAQIQLLRNYADPGSRAANLVYPPSPGLYGTDAGHAAHLYDSFFLKGKAPLWNQMGNGNWATDPTYAPKVIGLYAQMILFANAQA